MGISKVVEMAKKKNKKLKWEKCFQQMFPGNKRSLRKIKDLLSGIHRKPKDNQGEMNG